MRFIAIDTETTGFRNPLPVEIAAVDVSSGQSFCERIKVPLGFLEASATAVHGISDKDLDGCASMSEVLQRFVQFVNDGPVTFVAHNASFDKKVMENAFAFCQTVVPLPIQNAQWICTLSMSKKRLPLKFAPLTNHPVKHTLKDCCERANIAYLDGHSALPDAQMCAAI